MAISANDALIDAAGAYIRKRALAQPWYRRNANTVTTVLGFFATLLTWAASQPFATHETVSTVILIVGFILTIFGVQKTPNGWSVSQIKELNDAEAYFVDNTPLRVVEQPKHLVSEYTQDAASLAADVANFNQQRALNSGNGVD